MIYLYVLHIAMYNHCVVDLIVPVVTHVLYIYSWMILTWYDLFFVFVFEWLEALHVWPWLQECIWPLTSTLYSVTMRGMLSMCIECLFLFNIFSRCLFFVLIFFFCRPTPPFLLSSQCTNWYILVVFSLQVFCRLNFVLQTDDTLFVGKD